jgi:hypothetical protein
MVLSPGTEEDGSPSSAVQAQSNASIKRHRRMARILFFMCFPPYKKMISTSHGRIPAGEYLLFDFFRAVTHRTHFLPF